MADQVDELSERETEILRLVATGASNKEIAQKLFISTNTVKVHLRNIFAKIGVSSRTEAAMYAVNTGMLSTPRPDQEPTGQVLAPADQDSQQKTLDHDPLLFGKESAGFWSRPWLISLAIVIALLLIAVIAILVLPEGKPVVTQSQTTARWISLPDMPTARGDMAAVVYRGQIFALGGENNGGVQDAVEVYSVDTLQWSSLPPMPWAATDIQAAVIGDRIFLPGGRLESGDVSSALSIFDPTSGAWSQGAKLPFPLCSYALAVYAGKLYLFGGWDGQQFQDSVLEYDPLVDRWTSKSPLDVARVDAAAVLIDDQVHLIGGFNQSGALDLYQVYSPALENTSQNPWMDSGSLPDSRSSPAAAAVMKVVYLVGGQGDDAEVLPALGFLTDADEWLEIPAPVAENVTGSRLLFLDTQIYSLGGWVKQQASARLSSFQVLYVTVLPFIP